MARFNVDVGHFWRYFFVNYLIFVLIGFLFIFPFGIVFFAVAGLPLALISTHLYKTFIMSGGTSYREKLMSTAPVGSSDDSKSESVKSSGNGRFDDFVSGGFGLFGEKDEVDSGGGRSDGDERLSGGSGGSDDLRIEKIGYEDRSG